MATETVAQFKSSSGVLESCILIKDVITGLTLNQHIFPRYQEIIGELLSLDRALLQIEVSSGADLSLSLKDKAAPTIEQSRHYLIALLEKVRPSPTSLRVGSPPFLASAESEVLPDEKNTEDFQSSIKFFYTDLMALLAVESKTSSLNVLTSSTDKIGSEDIWSSLPSTSSLDWEEVDEPEYVQLAQIHTDDFAFGGVHYPETITYNHNSHQNANENAFLLEDTTFEDIWSSLPPTPSFDTGEDDVLTVTTSNQYCKSPETRRRMPSLHPGVQRGIKHGARDHTLYREATTGVDGLYHCPWEGKDPLCSHKPHRNKCIYSKFVDAHLKPYRCEVKTCENMCFASAAILLRHEREAHKMHGVSEWLHLCPAQDCARGVPGQGFPRHWNLVDHMKRVHNCSPKKHNSDPLVGCTMDCSGTTSKSSRRKKVRRASTHKKKLPISPPIDPAVMEPPDEMWQPQSESPQSIISPLRTESPGEMIDNASTQSLATQSTDRCTEHSITKISDNIVKSPTKLISESCAQAGQPNQSTPIEDCATMRVLESGPERVSLVEKQNREQRIDPDVLEPPNSDVLDGDSSTRKPPRCTRSKSGCLTCRKRKIKCDETQPACRCCDKGKRECRWPDKYLVDSYSKAGVQYKNLLSREPSFLYSVPLPTSQLSSRSQGSTLDNISLTLELQSAQNEEHIARNSQQSNEPKAIDEGDARLLHLLQASIQGK